MSKIRVLVVDDSVVIRRMISKVLEADPDFEIAGIAANGRIALQKIPQLNPDAITLDIEMPVLDGIATVGEIRKDYPSIPIIMFSTLSQRGASATLEALAAGATDYVTKPANIGNVTEGIASLQRDLLPKIKAHFNKPHRTPFTASRQTEPPKKTATPRTSFPKPNVICIGSSTGGPNALADLFRGIKQTLPVPTFIVQHMPPLFTKMLAERLDRDSPNRFFEGGDGQVAEPGCVYIAPGGKHMEIHRSANQVRIRLTDAPPENSCRPSVDVLFRSVHKTYGPHILATILTGMGSDGALGCEVINEGGGQIIAQDEASCVVWGMPRAVVEAQLAHKILPLDRIPGQIVSCFGPYPLHSGLAAS